MDSVRGECTEDLDRIFSLKSKKNKIKFPLSLKNAIIIDGVVRWIRQYTTTSVLEMFFSLFFYFWS